MDASKPVPSCLGRKCWDQSISGDVTKHPSSTDTLYVAERLRRTFFILTPHPSSLSNKGLTSAVALPHSDVCHGIGSKDFSSSSMLGIVRTVTPLRAAGRSSSLRSCALESQSASSFSLPGMCANCTRLHWMWSSSRLSSAPT